MKHIKLFNESKMPQYKKGEILVFSNEGKQFVKSICDKLGFTLLGNLDDSHDTFIVKTEVGKEEETGKIFLEEYPEFFWAYERRDLRNENFYEVIEDTKYLLDDLESMIGSKFLDQQNWNQKIEDIISSLNKLRF